MPNFGDFTHRIARRPLKEYCKYIYDAASESCQPWINPLQMRGWHKASPTHRLRLPKPSAGSHGASYTLAGALMGTSSHTGHHHPPTLCSGKHHFPLKHTSHGSAGTHTLLCCQHVPVLRNVTSTNTNSFKQQAFAPLQIWAFHTLSPYGGQAAVKTLETAL